MFLAVVSALALAIASALHQRMGPLTTVEGEGFCDDGGRCSIPALGAGFPLPYLIDDPQVSVPNSVGVVEDDFHPIPFAADALFYLLLLGGAIRYRRRRGLASERHAAGDPDPLL